MFVPEKEVKLVEDFVNMQRGKGGDASATPDLGAHKKFEKGVKVGNSVLDDCEASFAAADERRTKASTQFFSDTGIMALLCRHDCVLWLVNMTTKGEKQHYVITLLYSLFQHLPEHMTVGVLYDIGCQLHRSCVKWGLLGQFLKRVTFGISVFHAYGHQWPCQIIYHPRKCEGFGLTDGEGCERFWSAIKFLIPTLRVSGVSFYVILLSNTDCKLIHSSIIESTLSMHKSSIFATRHSSAWDTGLLESGMGVKKRR